MMVTAFQPLERDAIPRVPSDISQSAKLFRANCGPISFAALLGTQVIEVMRFFPQFPDRDYTNEGDMFYALESCGSTHEKWTGLPESGVALVQLEGPWTGAGVPLPSQLRYTHWIACLSGFVFDLNIGDWLLRTEWETRGAMGWMRAVKNCTGYHVRSAHRVSTERLEFSPFGRVPRRVCQ